MSIVYEIATLATTNLVVVMNEIAVITGRTGSLMIAKPQIACIRARRQSYDNAISK